MGAIILHIKWKYCIKVWVRHTYLLPNFSYNVVFMFNLYFYFKSNIKVLESKIRDECIIGWTKNSNDYLVIGGNLLSEQSHWKGLPWDLFVLLQVGQTSQYQPKRLALNRLVMPIVLQKVSYFYLFVVIRQDTTKVMYK